jgi:hypothetical protein
MLYFVNQNKTFFRKLFLLHFLKSKVHFNRNAMLLVEKGAMTLNIMALSIMTLIVKTQSLMALNLMPVSKIATRIMISAI